MKFSVGLAFVSASLALGCSSRPTFKCGSDAQCVSSGVQGVCVHPENVCALPDGNCPSGYRYDGSAGSLSGQCAPAPTDADMGSSGGGGGGGGGGSSDGDMAVAPAPSVSSVSPSMGPSTGGIGVAIGGSHFSTNATVTIGGQPATVMTQSASSISVVLPAGAVGAASVVVSNPDGQTGTGSFTYYATTLKFTEPTPATLQGLTSRAVVADFDKNGKADLAVCVRDPQVPPKFGNLQLYTGAGDGTFAAGTGTTITRNANDLDVGDFNKDGNPDVAVAFSTSDSTNQVGVLLGNGDGTFQTMKLVTVAPSPIAIALVDANGDGKLDIVTTSGLYMSSSMAVLLGNGDGTFTASPKISAIDLRGNMNAQAFGLALADFNDDSILDAAVAMGSGSSVAILLGNGDGTFRTNTTNLSTSPSATQVVVAGDWNKDGKSDLAIEVANQTGTINIHLGNGDGTFGNANPAPGAARSFYLATGDFNNDGITDIASSGYTYNGMSAVGVLQGKGDGTFMVQATPVVTGNPVGVSVGDFNKDGKLDIVAPTDQDKLSVMLNASQ